MQGPVRLDVPTLLPLFAALSLGVLSGCSPAQGQLDQSAVTDAIWGEAYSAQLSVVEVKSDGSLTSYSGPAIFAAGSGELPPGLSMNEAGLVTGTAEYVGTYELEVWVSGLTRLESFLDQISIEVSGVDAGGYIGHERDQLTQLYFNEGGRQSDMWVRAAGGGGPDQNVYVANVGVYVAGPNGVEEEGRNDDIRIGDLRAEDLEIVVGPWEENDEVDPHPGYPSGHYNDGSPATWDGALTFTAGSDTGEMDVSFSHPDYGRDSTRLMVVPPDWCTEGHQMGNYWDDPSAVCE